MKGLVYTGPNQYELRDCAMPEIMNPTDALIQMQHTSISGTDLHILKGDIPSVDHGRILGHEGVGTVKSLGSAVEGFFIGGWELGNVINGTQAEYVRIPHATGSLYKLPGNIDSRESVVLSDVFPTGMECGTLNANIQPGKSVAIVGAGPVGLAAMLTAKLYTPYQIVVIDKDDQRLEHAKRLGADKTVNVATFGAMEELDSISDKGGFDSVIEAAGSPTTFDLCQKLVNPGGALANIGVHGHKVTLDLDKLWDHNITIKTRLVDTITIPTLLQLLHAGRLNTGLLTHRYSFSDITQAYRAFQTAADGGVLKVLVDF